LTSLRIGPLDELVSTLVSEHVRMKKGVGEARGALFRGDYVTAKAALGDVERTFRQHIADEEGQVLRVLLDVYGREGSEEAIRVFRQHRPIYVLMQAISGFARLSPEELSRNSDELLRLLDDHTKAEETRIFPQALSAKRDARA
jgi:hypothetical protein